MKPKLIKILILIILFVFHIQYSFAATTSSKYYYQDQNIGILAYKEVNAFQITLSDGSILTNAALTTDSWVDIQEVLKKLQIVFVIDTSGSMSGTKVETTKSSTKDLVNSLFEKIGKENLEIGILYFNSGLDKDKILELTNEQNDILKHLDEIYANGGTQMADSLKKAKEMLKGEEENTSKEAQGETAQGNQAGNTIENQEDDDEGVIKIICTLSDGLLGDEENAMKEFENIHKEKISTMSIFVETPVTQNFGKMANQEKSLHKNFKTDTNNLADTIVNGIYNEIYMKIISMSEPKTSYNSENAAIIPGDDKIIFQVDKEILHGATLKIEYVFSIITAFPTTNIEILDMYSQPLNFNKDLQLITENKKNSDYGWKTVDGYLVVDSGNQIQSATKEYKIKLVLSTTLTQDMIDNLNRIQNYMIFSLNNMETGETINVQTSSDGVNHIKALDFLIIPPTGEFDTKKESAYYGIMILIIALYTIVAFCIMHYIRMLKGSKKDI